MKTVLLWLAIILALSVYPAQSGTTEGYADKLFHAVVYAITCLLFYSTFKGRLGRWTLILSVLLATGYGLLMEVSQEALGDRNFSAYDALANFVGAAAAALYIMTSRRYRRDKEG